MNLKSRFCISASLVCLSMIAAPSRGESPQKAPPKSARNASPLIDAVRTDEIVEVHPLGFSLKLPTQWLEWHTHHKNNLHFGAAELADAESPDVGDWDQEFAEVVNAMFPFEDCLFHAGGEAFGKEAASFADLQMRLYVIEGKSEKIEAHAVAKGEKAVQLLYTPHRVALRNGKELNSIPVAQLDVPPKGKKVTTRRVTRDKWKNVVLSYDLSYGDYGGTANVDVRLREFRNHTVVAVFMYANANRVQTSQLNEILESFEWPKRAQ